MRFNNVEIPCILLTFGDTRKLSELPASYADMVQVAKKKFKLSDDCFLTFRSRTPDEPLNLGFEIDDVETELFGTVIAQLDEIEVVVDQLGKGKGKAADLDSSSSPSSPSTNAVEQPPGEGVAGPSYNAPVGFLSNVTISGPVPLSAADDPPPYHSGAGRSRIPGEPIEIRVTNPSTNKFVELIVRKHNKIETIHKTACQVLELEPQSYKLRLHVQREDQSVYLDMNYSDTVELAGVTSSSKLHVVRNMAAPKGNLVRKAWA
ncbi:hypothetical protein BT96DRAFT_928824 [Gymnopus androsaceus JB14]|uniref:Uncharacterized protein n=1 Tax=Gymnopus androsaceus JB14 TaxID=1447944 RepID=A0A6A4GI95_9AGAR|nr:hypothetical protein BT96DRAFT_928824 [Gymnopus androsaceus JB14]